MFLTWVDRGWTADRQMEGWAVYEMGNTGREPDLELRGISEVGGSRESL